MDGKRVAVLQSNYIPWKGYFDIVAKVDCFIFYDDVQYTKNDWRNRNKILTENGPKWLTIPCGTDLRRLICEVRVDGSNWQESHWSLIHQNYSRAPYWSYVRPLMESLYLQRKWEYLSDLNHFFIRSVARDYLNLDTTFDDSRNYALSGNKSSRLLDLLEQVGATHYLSGPAAKTYLNEQEFLDAGISVEWMSYDGYPIYPQLYKPFEHAVSIVDLLFNIGGEAGSYLKHVVQQRTKPAEGP